MARPIRGYQEDSMNTETRIGLAVSQKDAACAQVGIDKIAKGLGG